MVLGISEEAAKEELVRLDDTCIACQLLVTTLYGEIEVIRATSSARMMHNIMLSKK